MGPLAMLTCAPTIIFIPFALEGYGCILDADFPAVFRALFWGGDSSSSPFRFFSFELDLMAVFIVVFTSITVVETPDFITTVPCAPTDWVLRVCVSVDSSLSLPSGEDLEPRAASFDSAPSTAAREGLGINDVVIILVLVLELDCPVEGEDVLSEGSSPHGRP